MARIIVSDCEKKEKSPRKQEVVKATYSVNTNEGLFQIETYGSSSRQNPDSASQTFQIDKDSAQQLIALLKKELFLQKLWGAFTDDFPLQQIFYGAPGTGKSHTINEITEQQPKENVFRTTFHPDSDYSTFVGCYKPTTIEVPMRDVTGKIIKENGADVTENRIVYKFVPQSFTKAYLRAWQTTEPVYLVIEEINRGNCAQIFGDLFQLLDRKCDGSSEYPIKADNDLAAYIAEKLSSSSCADIPELVRSGEELMLPSNLYIWATMNTSDQSLFPIDSAFKRRWDWKYIPIDTKKESWVINVNGTNYDWSDFLEKINAKIESATSSEDKMLGFYFCKAENNIISAGRFVSKVLFYLWNDVFKDYGFDDAIFNDDNNQKLSFRKFYKADGTVDENKVKKFLDNLQVQVENERPYGEDEEMNSVPDISVKRQSFWQGFNQARSTHPEYCDIYKNPKTPREEHFMDLSFGTSAYHPFLGVLFKKKTICVGISIYGTDRNTEIFEHFKENEAAINALAGVSLIFEKAQKPKNPDNPSYSIVAKKEIDINDESTWGDAYNWMMDMAVKMNEIKEKFGV